MTAKVPLSYGSYLKLDNLLSAQVPLTDAHDEMLFIIQHQTSELWMSLAIKELEHASALIEGSESRIIFRLPFLALTGFFAQMIC